MRVLLSGYYGFGNLGDEALLEVIVDRIGRRFPGVEVEVLSQTPGATQAAFGVAATPRWEWRRVREAIARADVVVSGGGGLLQNATSTRSLVYYTAVLREAIAAKRKAMIFAQSIGPLDVWGRFLVRRFCRGVARATVRDERSRELLHALLPKTEIERTADPVFLYDAADEAIDLSAEGLGPESGRYAVVSVRKASGARDVVPLLRRAVDRLSERHGIRVAFLPLGGSPDAEISTDVIRLCKSAPVLLPACPLARAAAAIRGAHVVLGMRLHALILAARYAVPFLALAYDPKVAALCEDLRYPLAPLWKADGPHLADTDVDDLVDALVERRDELGAHLRARVDVVRASAERNFDVLGELLRE
ncbi:MAG TPA: polysaccharide pyruvyl transferase CsaB [Candidatus Acidoferrales bacterium]|nr:polysaccharide pyruvyl transferase CsaB [Candidatus Acidoferrales bacterium]